MEETDFSGVKPNPQGQLQYIMFGANGGNPLSPMFIAGDDTSLQGHHAIVSNYLDGFGQVAGCQGPLDIYGGGYACDASVRIRRLEIWGPNMAPAMTACRPTWPTRCTAQMPVCSTGRRTRTTW